MFTTCAILRERDLKKERTKIPNQSMPMEKIPAIKLNTDLTSI